MLRALARRSREIDEQFLRDFGATTSSRCFAQLRFPDQGCTVEQQVMRALVLMALVGHACSGPWQLLELPPKSPPLNSHRLAQPSSFEQRGSKLCSIYGEPRPELTAAVLAAVISLVIEPRQRVIRAYGYRGGNSEARDYLLNAPHASLGADDVQVSIETRRSVGVVEVDRRDGSSNYCAYFKYDKDQRLSEVVLDETYVTATD